MICSELSSYNSDPSSCLLLRLLVARPTFAVDIRLLYGEQVVTKCPSIPPGIRCLSPRSQQGSPPPGYLGKRTFEHLLCISTMLIANPTQSCKESCSIICTSRISPPSGSLWPKTSPASSNRVEAAPVEFSILGAHLAPGCVITDPQP